MKWLILAFGILANASASVLIKVAVTPPRKFPSFGTPLEALLNWPLWLGVVLYGTAFLLYAAALARLPMNVAHPVLTAGSIGVVAMASALVIREPFYWNTVVGIMAIIVGVVLITFRLAGSS